MSKIIKTLVVAAALLFGNTACSAEVGKDYKLLNPAQPTGTKNIEVIEFFFYECSHCYDLHPHLAKWEKNKPKDVDMVYVPTIFRDSTEPLARTYFALESMGQIKQLDDAIYQGIHRQNAELYDLDSIAAFVAKHGVDRAKFSAAYSSFAMGSKVARAKQMIRSYGIQGTPTLVVDGKYVITGLHPADAIRVLDEVVAKVRKERSKKK